MTAIRFVYKKETYEDVDFDRLRAELISLAKKADLENYENVCELLSTLEPIHKVDFPYVVQVGLKESLIVALSIIREQSAEHGVHQAATLYEQAGETGDAQDARNLITEE